MLYENEILYLQFTKKWRRERMPSSQPPTPLTPGVQEVMSSGRVKMKGGNISIQHSAIVYRELPFLLHHILRPIVCSNLC